MARPRRRPMRPVPLESADAGRQPADGAPAGERFAAPRSSFGPWLKAQREARSVALSEIAEVSKISLRYLEALEQDRFEVLPAPVFVRGFLREYARVVGLDPDEVVNLYLVSVPRAPVERRSESPSSTSAMSAPSGRGLALVVGVVVVLLAAAAVAFWLSRRGAQSGAPAAVARAPVHATAAPKAAVPAATEPAVTAPSEASLAAGEPAPPPASALPAPAAASNVPAPLVLPPLSRAAERGSEDAGANPPLQLLLEFQQDCWVEVRIDGGRRASELRAGGETMTLEASEAIVLTLGNAEVVRAELNGRPLALPAGETKLLRDFRVDRSLLPSASPSPPAGRQ